MSIHRQQQKQRSAEKLDRIRPRKKKEYGCPNTIEVFCLSEEKDKDLRNELISHLYSLKRAKLITISYFSKILRPGLDYRVEIQKHLETAHIILPLISANFFASDDLYEVKMKWAVERGLTGGVVRVIPILLRPVVWEDDPSLSRLVVLPTNHVPVTNWADRNEAFKQIAETIRSVVYEILAILTTAEGDRHYRAKQLKEALAAYNQAIKYNHRYSLAYEKKGHVLLNQNNDEEACTAFEKALQLDPKNIHAYVGKGFALLKQGNNAQALADFERAIQLAPSFGHAYRGRGDVLLRYGYYEDALAAYEQALRLGSSSPELYLNRGDLFLAKGLYKEALNAYEKVLQSKAHEGQNIKASKGKADALFALKEYEKAIACYNSIFQREPPSTEMYSRRGTAHYFLQHYSEAFTDFEQASNLMPQQASYHCGRGSALYHLGRYQEALAAYKQALQLDPTVVEWYHYAADTIRKFPADTILERMVILTELIHISIDRAKQTEQYKAIINFALFLKNYVTGIISRR